MDQCSRHDTPPAVRLLTNPPGHALAIELKARARRVLPPGGSETSLPYESRSGPIRCPETPPQRLWRLAGPLRRREVHRLRAGSALLHLAHGVAPLDPIGEYQRVDRHPESVETGRLLGLGVRPWRLRSGGWADGEDQAPVPQTRRGSAQRV